MNREHKILILILIALIVGIAVVVIKPDYRVANNLASNRNYYPDVVPVASPDVNSQNSGLRPANDKDDPQDINKMLDIEF